MSVSEPILPSIAICSAGASAVSCSGTWSIDDIRSEIRCRQGSQMRLDEHRKYGNSSPSLC